MQLITDRTDLAIWHGDEWRGPDSKPEAIMIHSTRSGVLGRITFTGHDREMSSTTNWFKSLDSRASSNVVISPKEIVLTVPDTQFAWHAKEHSTVTLSIEVTQAIPTQRYYEVQYQKTAYVCHVWCTIFGIPKVYLSHYGLGKRGITGHEDSIQGIRDGKSDPGEEWDWEKFMKLLKGYDTVAEVTSDRALVWHKGFTYAERWGHYWFLYTSAAVDDYLARGYPPIVARAPRGSRIDY